MRLAWFHPGPLTPALEASDAVDLARILNRTHAIDQFNETRAHEFVWRHFTHPYDLAIYELGDSRGHTFVWPYLLRTAGVVVLHAASLHRSRSEALAASRRHDQLRAERRFSGWSLIRAPLLAARLVVVRDEQLARDLDERMPGLAIRLVPQGVEPIPLGNSQQPTRFCAAGRAHALLQRAAARARNAGSEVLIGGVDDITRQDVLVALDWPPTGAPPVAALRAMAAGLAVVVLETGSVAAWPALDPQSWQPRGYRSAATPIAVSIDPRDEEHSLMLAVRRLASDAGLRHTLGRAAQAWARQHASVGVAADIWESVLREAPAHAPLATGTPLPPHLTDDGTSVARNILAECGTSVDFLEP